jgi:hypothetical protein
MPPPLSAGIIASAQRWGSDIGVEFVVEPFQIRAYVRRRHQASGFASEVLRATMPADRSFPTSLPASPSTKARRAGAPDSRDPAGARAAESGEHGQADGTEAYPLTVRLCIVS